MWTFFFCLFADNDDDVNTSTACCWHWRYKREWSIYDTKSFRHVRDAGSLCIPGGINVIFKFAVTGPSRPVIPSFFEVVVAVVYRCVIKWFSRMLTPFLHCWAKKRPLLWWYFCVNISDNKCILYCWSAWSKWLFTRKYDRMRLEIFWRQCLTHTHTFSLIVSILFCFHRLSIIPTKDNKCALFLHSDTSLTINLAKRWKKCFKSTIVHVPH